MLQKIHSLPNSHHKRHSLLIHLHSYCYSHLHYLIQSIIISYSSNKHYHIFTFTLFTTVNAFYTQSLFYYFIHIHSALIHFQCHLYFYIIYSHLQHSIHSTIFNKQHTLKSLIILSYSHPIQLFTYNHLTLTTQCTNTHTTTTSLSLYNSTSY